MLKLIFARFFTRKQVQVPSAGEIYMAWCEAEQENEEFDLLYRG